MDESFPMERNSARGESELPRALIENISPVDGVIGRPTLGAFSSLRLGWDTTQH
jgi:hypothetical protein